MDVLVLGAGAREHALAWRLASDDSVGRVAIAPGNAGTAAVGRNVTDVDILDPDAVARHAVAERYGLVVVGPEAPLAAGVADALGRARIPVLGPGREAARLETSKAFAKDVMRRADVPMPEAQVFRDAESALKAARDAARSDRRVVVKADWLAAGKGVVVGETLEETEGAITGLFASPAGRAPGAAVLLEERLVGREVSLMALVSGERVVPLPAARDYKRLRDEDEGPNTGGMGGYAPLPWFSSDDVDRCVAEILEPVAWRIARDGHTFRGVLYAGLMVTAEGPRVLEFNVRFGDPEAQAVMPLIDGDLAAALRGCAIGDASEMERNIGTRPGASVAVVVAAEGYPDAPVTGGSIGGAESAEPGLPSGLDRGAALCFHGATRRDRGGPVESAGGRVLTFVGVASNHADARRTAYAGVESCRLEGSQHRRDIGRETTGEAPSAAETDPHAPAPAAVS